MIARPAAAALGCCSCQAAFYQAVRASSRGIRSFSLNPPQRLVTPAQRTFSVSRRLRSGAPQQDDGFNYDASKGVIETTAVEEPVGRPWFLDVDPPRHPPSDHKPELPKTPEDAPAMLEPLIKYIYEDMGLDELSLMDLRDVDPPPALGPNLIMLLGTARSERHLHVSAGRLVRWIKRNYKYESRADGLIGPGELRTKLRRLRKKAKLMGTNTAIVPGGDNGISTGWICVNFSADGAQSGESASFDDSGRFSGFGTAQTGTTIVVQCLTEARRTELDLENLWQGVLRRSLERARRIKGENTGDKADEVVTDALMASRLQLSINHSTQQWNAMKEASQRRYFSTSARRLNLDDSKRPTELQFADRDPLTETGDTAPRHTLVELRRQIMELQATGREVSKPALYSLISLIFQADPSPAGGEVQRLALVDSLLLTAQERGKTLLTGDMLVTLVESIVASPAYGPELQRAQENLEFLLAETQVPLDSEQVLRLMTVYALRHNWDRFWDVFRTPPRFRMPRTVQQYSLAYGALAATGDAQLCTDALRWVYPEMLREEPAMPMVGPMYDALKACIRVADPGAEVMLDVKPLEASLGQHRRWAHREFLAVLRDVEQKHEETLRIVDTSALGLAEEPKEDWLTGEKESKVLLNEELEMLALDEEVKDAPLDEELEKLPLDEEVKDAPAVNDSSEVLGEDTEVALLDDELKGTLEYEQTEARPRKSKV